MSKNLDEFFNDVSNEIVARKKRYVGKNFVNDDMKFSFNLFSVSPELSIIKVKFYAIARCLTATTRGLIIRFYFLTPAKTACDLGRKIAKFR